MTPKDYSYVMQLWDVLRTMLGEIYGDTVIPGYDDHSLSALVWVVPELTVRQLLWHLQSASTVCTISNHHSYVGL
jgi:hypothetical protein